VNDIQLLRYSRQIMLPQVDIEGQEKLLAARVLILGLGGLGSPAALYLAAAGVGELVLVDFDDVELSNLQRQIVHQNSAIGQSKVDSAIRTLSALNPETRLTPASRRLEGADLSDAIAGVDVVLDASDNFETRYALNDACFAIGRPLVSGAGIRFEGQVSVFDPRDDTSPCYRCLYPEGSDEALSCAENGVAAPLVGIIGTVQAMEAMKLITGVGDPLVGHVLYLDAMAMEWHKLRLRRSPDCPVHA
jgi:adenylyltransferase/sulfurtransferase